MPYQLSRAKIFSGFFSTPQLPLSDHGNDAMLKNPMEILDAYYSRPRIGRRFSLLPGPFAPRQKEWKQYLPWRVWAEIEPDRELAMKAAFGIGFDEPDSDAHWKQLLDDLADGRMFMRVICLHKHLRIPPGETRTQRQARMDRWLPLPFIGDGTAMQITWKSSVRFACPAKSITISPRIVPLLTGTVSHAEIQTILQRERGLARWLEDGQIFIACVD